MNVIAFVALPIYLSALTGFTAEIEGQPSERIDRSDRMSEVECSETVLEFTIGGVPHQTNSDYCSSQYDTDDQS